MARTVVIAEDEAIVRLDLREILEEQGFDVVGETGRGDEAVELARQHRPDLVILDIKMPGLDGLSAASEINVDRASAVLILTAFSQRNLIEQARDAGALAYLVKPFQQDEAENAALADDKRNLEQQLATRRWVDRAKGKLMDDHGMREAEAFTFVQQTAMNQRTTMREISEKIVEGEIVP